MFQMYDRLSPGCGLQKKKIASAVKKLWVVVTYGTRGKGWGGGDMWLYWDRSDVPGMLAWRIYQSFSVLGARGVWCHWVQTGVLGDRRCFHGDVFLETLSVGEIVGGGGHAPVTSPLGFLNVSQVLGPIPLTVLAGRIP